MMDNFGKVIEIGTKVRFVAGRPRRARTGRVTHLDNCLGTLLVKGSDGRTYGMTEVDVQVLPQAAAQVAS